MLLSGVRVRMPDLGAARTSNPVLPLVLPIHLAASVSLSVRWTHQQSLSLLSFD